MYWVDHLMGGDPFIGRQLGDFLIRDRIAQGGMAIVYRAYQPSVSREVALKMIPLGEAAQDDLFRRRFAKEAELIASLEHIHILPVYDYGIAEDAAYLAMRLLTGGTMNDLLKSGPLAMEEATRLFRQFASGLAYAHRKGVIHRDLKPSNIMLDDDGNVLLTDFGLAKLIEDSVELTQTGSIVGTPAYMSPEQLRGRQLDHRSDIYSAGVVLYQILTGRTPFGGPATDLVTTIYKQLEETPQSPRTINPAILPDVELVILRALRKSPDDRYDTVEDMSDDLVIAVEHQGSSADLVAARLRDLAPETLAGPEPKFAPSPARRLAYYAGGIGAVLIILVLLAVLVSSRSDKTNAPETYPAPTVRVGEEARATDSVPTQAEIARARDRLGGTGFIAYITCTLSTEYHATQAREIGDFAAQFGLSYRIYDSNADPYTQLTLIEKARAEGATGLIVCPLNSSLLDEPLLSVQRAAIPLVIMHSDMPSYGGVVLAGDDYTMGLEAGRFAGKIIAKEMNGQADVIILDYPDLPVIVMRADGLEDGLREYAPEAHVIGRYKGGTREFAEASVDRLIEQSVTFNVILSINDAGSFGAIAAMEKAQFAPDSVIISSIDGEALARDYIQKGYFIRGSVAINREEFSHTAINAMVKLLAGSTLPETFVISPGDVLTRDTLATQ
jgi:serine/threonine protein kinase/DNA-binding LacI/PurR family transcriptional regulator